MSVDGFDWRGWINLSPGQTEVIDGSLIYQNVNYGNTHLTSCVPDSPSDINSGINESN